MALAIIDRALDAFHDFVDGAGVSLDLDQPPARTEDAPVGLYNVGQIVSQYTHEWLGVAPNHATPGNLLSLLLTLDELTAQLEAHVEKNGRQGPIARTVLLGTMGVALPGLGPGLWMVYDRAQSDEARSLDGVELDLKRWRLRLDEYIRHTEAAPDPNDRMWTLWEVTAPLFLGWYGGPTGDEIALPQGSVPPTFDTKVQHLADLGTPYQLANQLGVWMEWSSRTKRLLWQDIKDEAKDLAKKAKDVVEVATSPIPYLVAGTVLGSVATALIRRKLK